jgi:cell wall-associated NlpC family hydrolase
MPTSNGISGAAVAVATFGAVLVYAGFRGVSPLQALRDAAGGKPPPVKGKPTTPIITSPTSSSGLTDPRRAAVVAAAQKYVSDQYSQLRRRDAGYSDCSSFVDKALKDAGIQPPGDPWANTANFRASGDWVTIPASQVDVGDIAISLSHMVLITAKGGNSGIGQQRPFVNVKTGDMQTLFGPAMVYSFKTYKGYSHPAAGSGGSGGGGGSW